MTDLDEITADLAERNDTARHLLAAATRFSFGTVGGPNAQEQVDVELRPGLDEHSRPVMRWAVVCFDWVFNRRHGRWTYAKDDCWVPEPIPSYRSDEYLATHRYDTLDEAISVARGLLADGHPYAGPWTRRRLDD